MLKLSQSSLMDPVTNRIKEKTSSVRCVPLLSVSVNQIVKLFVPQIGLIVHKHLIGLVKLIAKIVDKLTADPYITIKIDDGSYSDGLKVVCYRGSHVDLNHLIIGDYIKLFGKIKMDTDGLPCLVAYRVEPITEFNEISLHYCEIVRESLELRKIKNKVFNVTTHNKTINTTTTATTTATTTTTTATTTTTTATTTTNTSATSQVTTNPTIDEGQASDDVNPSPSTSKTNDPTNEGSKRPGYCLNGLQSDILNLLGQCKKPEGLSIQAIREAFPTVSSEQFQAAIDFLDCEAHIYHTIDDHYQSVYFSQ